MDFFSDINVDGLIEDMKVDITDLIDVIQNEIEVMDTKTFGEYETSLGDQYKSEINSEDDNKELLADVLEEQNIKTEEGESRQHWLTDHGNLLDDILNDENADFVKREDLEMNENQDCMDWVADSTVPEGWMIRRNPERKNNIHVRSPTGRVFQCRRQALEFLRKNNFPQTEINIMNEKLAYEGWFPSEYLPVGWKYRMDSNRSPTFLSPTDEMLSSAAVAVKYIENSSLYDLADLKKFIVCVEQLTKMKALMTYDWKCHIYLGFL